MIDFKTAINNAKTFEDMNIINFYIITSELEEELKGENLNYISKLYQDKYMELVLNSLS